MITITENKYFDFNNPAHKFFFAGLLNTAKNNFDLTLVELGRRINKFNVNKGLILDVFNDTITDADWNSRVNYISESLVFVKYLKYETRASFRNTLYTLYETIDGLRNSYTHYIHEEKEVDLLVFKVLDDLMFISAKTVKKNRAKSEEYKVYLSKKYKEEFNEIIKNSKAGIDIYNKNLAKNEKKRYYIKPEFEVNYVLNFVFRSFIYNDKKSEKEILSLNASSKIPDENKFSSYGFILLMALFLNKKQTETLLSCTKYLKGNKTLKHIVSRWTFTFLCYKDIRKLFKSEYTNDSLLLQMVSELTKCPDALYQQLDVDKKQEFIEDLNIYFKDNDSFNGNNDQALVSHEVIRKRYQNSFPYFAIRFLDEIIGFPNLRFHVNLGKFNHHTSLKSQNSIFETERKVLEKITVFTKLSEATKQKKDYFNKPENKDLINDWTEFPAPSYQFNHNNIGFWLNINNTLGCTDALPDRDGNKLSKLEITDKLNLVDAVKKPVAFLSFNELPALLYALLIDEKTPKEIESVIISKIFKQQSLIRKFDEGTDVNNKNIPAKLKKAIKLSVTSVDNSKLVRAIEKESKKNPLNDIRAKYRKPVLFPNEFSNVEKGKIAIWLTNDIKRFVSRTTRSSIKGYQVATLQALFAFYDVKRDDVNLYIKDELQLDLKEDNPFKGIDFSKKTLFLFYESYLRKRKTYLGFLMNALKNNSDELNDEIFNAFTKKLYEIKTIEKQKEYFLNNNPVNLPRGIFDDNPTSFNRKNNDIIKLADWFKQSSNIDEAQKYYSFNKVYNYTIEVLKWNHNKKIKEPKKVVKKQIINVNKGLTQQYNRDLPKDIQKEIYKNEKGIRKIMREDFYVLEMVKYVFRETNLAKTALGEITLKDVYLTNYEKEAIIEKSNKQRNKPKGDFSASIINDSYILSKKIELSILDGKIKDLVSIKQIGKFRNLEEDQRVRLLVEYFPEKTPWNSREVLAELDAYDKIRMYDFFNTVHCLESEIYEKAVQTNCLEELKTKGGKPNFRHYLSFKYLNNEDSKIRFNNIEIEKSSIGNVAEDLQSVYLLVKIRNKFSHNQFLQIEDFKFLTNLLPLEKDEKIAFYMNRVFNYLLSKPSLN